MGMGCRLGGWEGKADRLALGRLPLPALAHKLHHPAGRAARAQNQGGNNTQSKWMPGRPAGGALT